MQWSKYHGGLRFVQALAAIAIVCSLPRCALTDGDLADSSRGSFDPLRQATQRASAGLPTAPQQATSVSQAAASKPSGYLLFPGTEQAQTEPSPDLRGPQLASNDVSVFASGDGVEINFEGTDIQAAAKLLLGDILDLNYLVDSRVQGTVTLASVGPIPRKDVLRVFESALRASSVAVVREGSIIKIVPVSDAVGSGRTNIGAGQPGYGVSVVPLHYTSATAIARIAENFLSRPGAIRADDARNLVLIQGTAPERQTALDMIATFDVEWLRNQSVGVYPLKTTSPETMIRELDRIFESNESGRGQGVIRFQPIARMNAVMAVAKSPKLLERATQWVKRLDVADVSGASMHIYRLNYGSATRVAALLNDTFMGKSSTTSPGSDVPASQIAPGEKPAQVRLDSLKGGTFSRSAIGGTNVSSQTGTAATDGSKNAASNKISAAFEMFSDQKSGTQDPYSDTAATTGGKTTQGVFENVRITADPANNSVVVYANAAAYRVIERAIRDIDRQKLQVAIEATVAEVTLNDDLKYGIQYFLTGSDVGTAPDKGSVGLFNSAQSAILQRVLPGFNLLLGPESQPRLVLDALSAITNVKVLSSPSVVVLDNQPALLQVGDEVPIVTRTATLIDNPNAPVVNNIEMRNTGVILKVLPHVYPNGTIQLEIDQEISNVINQDQQSLTPTISQRRVHSTVSVNSGYTVLLGGLISERQENKRSGIPGLRQIQYLGDLFGDTNNTKTRSEIIIFIKPKTIRNIADSQVVAEEFRDGLDLMRRENTAPTPQIETTPTLRRLY